MCGGTLQSEMEHTSCWCHCRSSTTPKWCTQLGCKGDSPSTASDMTSGHYSTDKTTIQCAHTCTHTHTRTHTICDTQQIGFTWLSCFKSIARRCSSSSATLSFLIMSEAATMGDTRKSHSHESQWKCHTLLHNEHTHCVHVQVHVYV